jgi:hypothetical protein
LLFHPEKEQKYLKDKLGETLEDFSNGMLKLAGCLALTDPAQKAPAFFERFGLDIPPGKKGRGGCDKIDLGFGLTLRGVILSNLGRGYPPLF